MYVIASSHKKRQNKTAILINRYQRTKIIIASSFFSALHAGDDAVWLFLLLLGATTRLEPKTYFKMFEFAE